MCRIRADGLRRNILGCLRRRLRMKVKYLGPDLPGSLVSGKVYEVLATENGFYRIIDESGEDYLYDKRGFVIVKE